MGFSVSATMAIFFATFLILFSVLYSSVNSAFDSVTESFDEKYEYISDRSQTSLEILSISCARDTGSLEIKIQNTGAIPLDTLKTSLLVGGLLAEHDVCVGGDDSTTVWLPLETATMTVDSPNITFDSSIYPRTSVINDNGLASPANMTVGDAIYLIDGMTIDVFTIEGVFNFTIDDGAHLVSPSDVKVWDDRLYVLDEGTHIDRLDLDGNWIDRLVDDPGNTSAPSSIAADAEYIYAVDGGDHVDRFNRSTGVFVDRVIANGGTMSEPKDLVIGSCIFVIDFLSGSYHIDRYDLDGTNGVQIVTGASLSTPTDIAASAADLANRYLFVVNGSREIAVFDEDGTLLGSISSGLSDSVVGVDVAGKIFVSDGVNGLVIENLGTNIKVVVENGISEVTML
jgi:archaellum component FlaF (FlaF/FlaG flagellin family)